MRDEYLQWIDDCKRALAEQAKSDAQMDRARQYMLRHQASAQLKKAARFVDWATTGTYPWDWLEQMVEWKRCMADLVIDLEK